MKKLLPFVISCLVGICFIPALAQVQTVSTYPIVIPVGYAPGISFELTTTQYIEIRGLETGVLKGGVDLNVYYRSGGVQTTPGVQPVINAANGWNHHTTMYINATNHGVPAPGNPFPVLFLPPGNYGFYLADTSGNNKVAFRPWISGFPTNFTNAPVTIKTGPNYGYSGPVPIVYSNDTVQFVGKVTYYAYSHLPEDIGIVAIDSPAFPCPGNNNIIAKLRNYGSTQIHSVDINWTINGGTKQTIHYIPTTPIDTIGGINPYDAIVTLGIVNTNANDEVDIEVWTSNPNGNADPVTSNDTLSASINTAMSGIYSINAGGSGSTNFKHFNEAVYALYKRGICAPVTFKVAAGSYNEHIAVNKVEGTSAINTITFEGDLSNPNLVKMNYVSPNKDDSNYVVKFNGCDHIIFKGFQMNANGIANFHTTAIWFSDGAKYNVVRNCELLAPLITQSRIEYAVVISEGESKNSYNRIENNYIYGGSFGIRYRGTGLSDLVPGVVIKDNYIKDAYYNSIYAYFTDAVQILGNTMFSNSVYGDGNAMWVTHSYNGFKVIGNTIKSPGISPLTALYMRRCNGTPTNRGLIANNMFHSGSPTHTGIVCGLNIVSGSYIDLIHNNVVVEGTDSLSKATNIGGTYINVLNNNFLHYGNGVALQADSGTSNFFDYNNLATSGSYLVNYDSGSFKTTLADWQLTGFGLHSINIDSLYTNLDSLRTCDSRIAGVGTPSGLVTDDIDHEPRKNPPDIGADEFLLSGPAFFSIGDTIKVCTGEKTKLEILSGNLRYGNYSWSTGDTTPTIIASDTGKYSLTVSACITASDDVELISIDPIIDFDIDNKVNEYLVTFTNTSKNGTTYLWEFGEGNIDTNMNTSHQYDSNGTYTVTLTVMNRCDTLTLQKEVVISVYIGHEENNQDIEVKVYPNPVNDNIKLKIGNLKSSTIMVELLNSTGNMIHNQQFNTHSKNIELINVSPLSKGLYFIRITFPDKVITEQIIIQ